MSNHAGVLGKVDRDVLLHAHQVCTNSITSWCVQADDYVILVLHDLT